jgi:flagellar biosynthetic protein FliR
MPWEPFLATLMGALRALGIVMILPIPGGRGLPTTLRAALSFLLGGALTAAVPMTAVGPLSTATPELLIAGVHELLLGLAMGLTGRIVLSSAELAGRVIAGEVGLNAAPGFDVPVPAQEPLPSFTGMFAGLLFFVTNAHEGVLAAFARSFEIAPPGMGGLSPGASETLTGAVATLLALALRIAAPFIALNFVITLGFSILGRAVPKMNVFIISYALRSIMGFTLLAGAGALIARYFAGAFDRLPWTMLELVARR